MVVLHARRQNQAMVYLSIFLYEDRATFSCMKKHGVHLDNLPHDGGNSQAVCVCGICRHGSDLLPIDRRVPSQSTTSMNRATETEKNICTCN